MVCSPLKEFFFYACIWTSDNVHTTSSFFIKNENTFFFAYTNISYIYLVDMCGTVSISNGY